MTFNRLTSDPLTATANPINPAAWLQVNVGDDVLEVTGGSCTTTVANQGDGTVVNKAITWPNDQWCEVKLVRMTFNGVLWLYLRAGAEFDTPCYALAVVGPFNSTESEYSIVEFNAAGDAIVHTWVEQGTFVAVAEGDIIKFAIQGSPTSGHLYFYVNSTLVFTGNLADDTTGGITSGSVGMQLASGSTPPLQSDIAVNSFIGGSIS